MLLFRMSFKEFQIKSVAHISHGEKIGLGPPNHSCPVLTMEYNITSQLLSQLEYILFKMLKILIDGVLDTK